MFKTPFLFEGRIRRLEYCLSYLIYIISIAIVSLTMDEIKISSISVIPVFIPLLWLLFAQGAKRCHDRGNSGWYQLIPFYVLWMLFADGDPGNNLYGPNPKDAANTDDIDEIGNYLERND